MRPARTAHVARRLTSALASRAASATGSGGPHHYTQRAASKLAKRLPGADVLLAHCPPRGINDDPGDPAHVGFDGLLDWVERHRPRHLLHGHTHPVGGLVDTVKHVGPTRVHWIHGARVVVLD